MFDAGWLVPGWPPERGGRNAGPIETLVYLEELMRAGVPRTTNPQGLGIVVPSLFDYGTDAQVHDYAFPILRGERSACLGMSEPGAGSDLASLSTRAVRDGEHFVVNGQKVWTSGAAHADFCFLFCRTDPEAPKHKGISVLLVDMATPGITVRPLAEIVHPERGDLSEVFFEDAVVPADNLVGRLNDGWAMANGSLAHERGMVWLRAVLELEENVRRLIDEAPARLARLGDLERAVHADRIAAAYVDALASRALGYRGFAKFVRGGNAPEQALMKAFCSEARRRACLVGAELGADEATDVVDVRPRSRSGVGVDRAVLQQLRHDDLGGVVRDPAQHHRRARARAAAWLTGARDQRAAGNDRRSAPTSSSARNASFRCVHVDGPVRSARTAARRPPAGAPTRRDALAAAPGHSGYGRGPGVASHAVTASVAGSTVARTAYSCTTVSTSCASTWLSRKKHSAMPTSPSRHTSSRRRRRVECGGSASCSCQPRGSASGSISPAAGPMWNGGPKSVKPLTNVPPATHPAQMSTGSGPLGSRRGRPMPAARRTRPLSRSAIGRSSSSCRRTAPGSRFARQQLLERGAEAPEGGDADQCIERAVGGFGADLRDHAVREVDDEVEARRVQHRGVPVGVGAEVTSDRDRGHRSVESFGPGEVVGRRPPYRPRPARLAS